MFEIEYHFPDTGPEEAINPNELVQNNYFRGNLVFKNGNHFLFMEWNNIDLIDSAFGLVHICNELLPKRFGRKEYKLKESNEELAFEKNDYVIKIIPSFSMEVLEMSTEDFRKGIEEYYKNVIFDVLRKNQSLKINLLLIKYLNEAEKI